MLLDCGGGTVDSIVHEVLASGGVKEALEASGGPWGSRHINDQFEEFLRNLIGIQYYDAFKKNHSHEHFLMLEKFELKVKVSSAVFPSGKGSSNESFQVVSLCLFSLLFPFLIVACIQGELHSREDSTSSGTIVRRQK